MRFPSLFSAPARSRRTPVIETRRLLLRPLTGADAEAIATLAGDWDVARMTARVPYPYSRAVADHWIDDLAEGEFVRGIEHDGRLIGVCGFNPMEGRSAEIGYWIGKPWWGQGFATEAAGALIGHCFAREKIKRLVCCHFVDNPASARVIAKLGFRLTGSCRTWCEARRADVESLRYERHRPFMARSRAA